MAREISSPESAYQTYSRLSRSTNELCDINKDVSIATLRISDAVAAMTACRQVCPGKSTSSPTIYSLFVERQVMTYIYLSWRHRLYY